MRKNWFKNWLHNGSLIVSLYYRGMERGIQENWVLINRVSQIVLTCQLKAFEFLDIGSLSDELEGLGLCIVFFIACRAGPHT